MIKDLTGEQKNILLKEDTEPPGSSSLNYEKREGDYICVGCGAKLFESSKNMKVVVAGHHFSNHYLMYLKPRQTI